MVPDIFSLTVNFSPQEYEESLIKLFGNKWYDLELETIFIGLKKKGFKEISEYSANKIGAIMCCLHNMDSILNDWASFEITGWGITSGYVNSYSLNPLNTAQLIAFLEYLQEKGASIPEDLSLEVKGYIQSALKNDYIVAPPGILKWAGKGLYNEEVQNSIYFRLKTVSKDRRSLSLVEEHLFGEDDIAAEDDKEYLLLWQVYKSIKSENYAHTLYKTYVEYMEKQNRGKTVVPIVQD